MRALIVIAGMFVPFYPTLAAVIETAPAGAMACSGCHPAAAGVMSPVPRLIGMEPAGIVKAMQEYRAGKRAATVMDRIARGFTDDEIQAIAEWYARQR
jgi:cytochrome c553